MTFQAPDADRYGYGADYLRGRIIGALGGRAAEEMVYGDITTGAESDLEQVTNIARRMVGPLGDVGGDRPGLGAAGAQRRAAPVPGHRRRPDSRRTPSSSWTTEVRRIVDDCYDEAVRMLRENRERLDALAQALLERETLDEADAYRVAGITREGPPA